MILVDVDFSRRFNHCFGTCNRHLILGLSFAKNRYVRTKRRKRKTWSGFQSHSYIACSTRLDHFYNRASIFVFMKRYNVLEQIHFLNRTFQLLSKNGKSIDPLTYQKNFSELWITFGHNVINCFKMPRRLWTLHINSLYIATGKQCKQ